MFKELFTESETEDQFEVSKYIAKITRQINPNDKKNIVTIHLKQSKRETKEFIIDYLIDENGDGVSTNTWNDINDGKSDRKIAEHHRIGIRKMSKGWKITSKVTALMGKYKQEFKDNQKLTSDEVQTILKDLPLGKD